MGVASGVGWDAGFDSGFDSGFEFGFDSNFEFGFVLALNFGFVFTAGLDFAFAFFFADRNANLSFMAAKQNSPRLNANCRVLTTLKPSPETRLRIA